MKQLKRILLMMMAVVVIAVGTFCTYGQKNSNDNRPPKEQPKIVEKPKPPPSNSNSNRKKP